MVMFDSSFDVVIIGGGTAGLTLAAHLSEDPSVQVVVLEAGEDNTADPRVSTPAMWPRTMGSEIDWAFRTTKQSALGGRELPCPAGRTLGGTSSTNSCLISPTSKSHVDAWSGLGNPGWDWAAFSTAVRKSFHLNQQGDGNVHLKVPDLNKPENGWQKVWANAIGALGYPDNNDPFSGTVCGAVIAPETIDPMTGKRCSSANAHFERVHQRSNLTAVTGATVDKILFAETKPGVNDAIAKGVAYTIVKDGKPKKIQVKACKEVILAAGALSSPRLLELSGVGNAALLHDMGIQVMVDNPHVGENLQNHVLVGRSFEVRDESDLPSRDPLNRREPAVIEAAMTTYTKGEGPLATCGTNAYAHLPFPDIESAVGREAVNQVIQDAFSERKESVTDNPNITPAFAALHTKFVRSVLSSPADAPLIYIAANTFVPYDAADPTFRPPGKHFSISAILTHPLSHGSVHITSTSTSSLDGGMAIDPQFLSHPLDTEILARSLRYIEEKIAKAEPLSGHLKPQEAKFEDVEETKEYIRRTVRGGNHWVGSCSMMPREIGGVVDAQLRVYGCKNLRICDASVIPIVSRGNTLAAVYGVAELGAKIIRKDL